MILNEVLGNIKLLQFELQKVSSLIQSEIISVIIDGSVIRGDFIEDSSDIDITITTLNKKVDLQVKQHIEEVVKNIQSKLPKRGYPKLWLYAFDSIKNHKVIYGQDITEFYTKIEPKYFVPIRVERIQRSVMDLNDRVSNYELDKGGITQIKNAWEAIRCICIHNGMLSIRKSDIFLFSKTIFSERADLEVIEDLYYFYLNKQNVKLLQGNFRRKLYHFTLNMIQKYYLEN